MDKKIAVAGETLTKKIKKLQPYSLTSADSDQLFHFLKASV